MKTLLATAAAASEVNAQPVADELTLEAADLAKTYQPAFSLKMRLAVATSLFHQNQRPRAESIVDDGVLASRSVSSAVERLAGVREFARLLVDVDDREHLARLIHNSDPFTAAVCAIIAAQRAAQKTQVVEARRLAAAALTTATAGTYPHQAYLMAAVIDATVSAGWLTRNLEPVLEETRRLAGRLQNGAEKSRVLRHIGAAWTRLDKPAVATVLLDEISDSHERDDLAQVVIRAFARAGRAEAVISMLTQPGESSLQHVYLVSEIAAGMTEGRQIRIFPRIEDVLREDERTEVRLLGSAAWEPSASAG